MWNKTYVAEHKIDEFINHAFTSARPIFAIVPVVDVTPMPSAYVRGYWVYYTGLPIESDEWSRQQPRGRYGDIV